MNDHDPLCVNRLPGWCYCDLIARVRADEREYLLGRTYVDRERLRAQVEALPPHGGGERMFVWREDVLALLGGESDGS